MIRNFVKGKGFSLDTTNILSEISKDLNLKVLFFLILSNVLLILGLFLAVYPILIFSLMGIVIFLAFKKQQDILFISICYQVYFLVTSVFINIEFGNIIGYSDQYLYKHISEYYFNSNFQFYEIAFNTIEFKYYLIKLAFTKIIYFLMHLSNGRTEILIFFNYSLYFLSLILVYKNFRYLFSSDKEFNLFFLMLVFLPPSIFINSLFLKESIIMSLMVFLLVFIVKRKIIYSLLILSLIFYLRSLYIPIFFIIYFSLVAYYKKNFLQILIVIVLLIFTYQNIDKLNSMNSKFINYFVQAKSNHVDIRNTEATLIKFANLDDLVSLRNAIILPIAGILTPNPMRFLKPSNTLVYLESFFISIFWWITLPFFVIFILKAGIQLKIAMLSIFLTVFLSSTFSILTIDGEVFRHRFPLYSILTVGGIMGYYFYFKSFRFQYKLLVWFWYYATFFIYFLSSIL